MEKYPALRTASGAANLFGWFGIIAAVILFIWGIVDIGSIADGVNGGGPLYAIIGAIKIGNAFALCVMGVLLMLAGEAAKVFIDIERNTRSHAIHAVDESAAHASAPVFDTPDNTPESGTVMPVPFEEIELSKVYVHSKFGNVTVVQIFSRRSVRVMIHKTFAHENVDPANLGLSRIS